MIFLSPFFLISLFRFFDLSTTYFVGSGDLSVETSPLVRVLGFDWKSLLLYNLAIVLFLCFFYYLFNEKAIKEKENEFRYNYKNSFRKYLLYIFFNKVLSFRQILFTKELNIKIFSHTLIIALIITFIMNSFFAGIHNILVVNFNFLLFNSPEKYTLFSSIFSLIIILTSFFIYLKKRLKKLK